MELRAVCSDREITARIRSCLVGKGEDSWLEPCELLRLCPAPLGEQEEVSDGGCPLDFGGGVEKVW